MSFVGLVVTACPPSSADLSRVSSIDDLQGIPLDEATSVMAFTRNGWLNNRLEEIARIHHLALLPTGESPAVTGFDATLDRFIDGLGGFLQSLRHDPGQLPAGARELADDDEVRHAIALAPASLDAAIAAFKAATARDEDGEQLETLLSLLWCQLRLAEHAQAQGLRYLCVRSP